VASGRPRSFCMDAALDRAMEVFWRKGFEGASLPDLTEAMGINRPSLYAAFGNKESLFKKALDRYAEGPAAKVRAALEQPTARRVAEEWLCATVQMLTNPKHPHGCLSVQGGLACGDAAESIRRELVRHRQVWQDALRDRFRRAIDDGDLPPSADAAHLAQYIATFAQGLAVQAASGATCTQLQGVVQTALQAFPESKVEV
jgi:AcrR family transcriptional regulator